MPRRDKTQDAIAQAFGSALRARREHLEETLEDVAHRIGMTA